ncbi:hypothetical protein [Mangrovibacterium sp.]|uniref:hypothetical protein n=1 Tax=Mangrovibacterium sp. TaxID=1961364 RepID=UPI003569DE04
MKTALYLIPLAILFLYMAYPVISFHPFRVQFERWPQAVGTILMLIAMLCFLEQGRRDGNKQAIEVMKEVYESKQNQEQ